MTRPSGDTNEPEPPLLKRTDDFCTCSSHLSEGSKPYLSLRTLRGGLLKSHMPSSAGALEAPIIRVSPNRVKKIRSAFMVVAPSLVKESGGCPPGVRRRLWK